MQDYSFDRIGFELIGGILHTNVGIAILEVPHLWKQMNCKRGTWWQKAWHVLAYRGTPRQALVKPKERL